MTAQSSLSNHLLLFTDRRSGLCATFFAVDRGLSAACLGRAQLISRLEKLLRRIRRTKDPTDYCRFLSNEHSCGALASRLPSSFPRGRFIVYLRSYYGLFKNSSPFSRGSLTTTCDSEPCNHVALIVPKILASSELADSYLSSLLIKHSRASLMIPNVLLIGAMKSGTTGLYMDLATHPDVFLAQDKEPRCLCSDEVLTEAGRRRYAQRYAASRAGQIALDASTDYAKRPHFNGVVQRALQVLPEGFKVIYLVRHPIDRIVSQHHHEYSAGLVGESQDHAVRRHSRYIDYSSYAYQLEPWVGAIGLNRIKVIRFEDYANRRQQTIDEVCEFLKLEPNKCQVEVETVHNKSEGKPVPNGFWRAIARNPVYKNFLRRFISPQFRLAVYRWILPSAPEKLDSSPDTTMNWLRESLTDDVHKLSKLLGLSQPLWDDFPAIEPQPTHCPSVTIPLSPVGELEAEPTYVRSCR